MVSPTVIRVLKQGPAGASGKITASSLVVSTAGASTVDSSLYQTVRVTSATGGVTLNVTNAAIGSLLFIKDAAGNAHIGNVTLTDASNPAAKWETPDLNAALTSVSYFTKNFGVIYMYDGANWKLLASENCQVLVEAAGGGAVNSGNNGGITLVGNGATDVTGVTPAMHWRTTESINQPNGTTARINVYPNVGGNTKGYWALTVRDAATGSPVARLVVDSLTGSHLTHSDGGFAISTFNSDSLPTVVAKLTAGTGNDAGNFVLSGGLNANGNIKLFTYLKANLPVPPSDSTGAIVFVLDDVGGKTIAFSDGSNWRRVRDNAIVS